MPSTSPSPPSWTARMTTTPTSPQGRRWSRSQSRANTLNKREKPTSLDPSTTPSGSRGFQIWEGATAHQAPTLHIITYSRSRVEGHTKSLILRGLSSTISTVLMDVMCANCTGNPTDRPLSCAGLVVASRKSFYWIGQNFFLAAQPFISHPQVNTSGLIRSTSSENWTLVLQ